MVPWICSAAVAVSCCCSSSSSSSSSGSKLVVLIKCNPYWVDVVASNILPCRD